MITTDGELVELEMKIGLVVYIRLLVEGGDFERGSVHYCLDGNHNIRFVRLVGRVELMSC